MKTLIAATAIMMLSFSSVNAEVKKSELFFEINGNTLFMPVAAEELVEALPFDSEKIFHEELQEYVENNIDISGMIKPEQEVYDIPAFFLGSK
jgi:hypothetical protein